MPLGTVVGLGPGDIVLDGDPASPSKTATAAARSFRSTSIVAKLSPVSELLSSCLLLWVKDERGMRNLLDFFQEVKKTFDS